MELDRRSEPRVDRRANTRGGRRDEDARRNPWYRRRRLWLTIASMAYVGWRRIAGGTRKG
jgi:hypothetical protein